MYGSLFLVDGATVPKGTTEMKGKERNEWFFGFGIPRRVIDRIEIAHPATTNMVISGDTQPWGTLAAPTPGGYPGGRGYYTLGSVRYTGRTSLTVAH